MIHQTQSSNVEDRLHYKPGTCDLLFVPFEQNPDSKINKNQPCAAIKKHIRQQLRKSQRIASGSHRMAGWFPIIFQLLVLFIVTGFYEQCDLDTNDPDSRFIKSPSFLKHECIRHNKVYSSFFFSLLMLFIIVRFGFVSFCNLVLAHLYFNLIGL